jgi:hypothetical protein
MLVTDAHNQSCPHTRVSILSSLREFLTGFNILPLVLNADSDVTVKLGQLGYLGLVEQKHDILGPL